MEAGEPRARLIVSEEGRADRTVEVGDCLTIGRSQGNTVVLEDQVASRRHAEIRHHGGGRYTLLDSGSANGTWLNARRLTGLRELSDGDVIAIGRVRLRFCAPAGDRGPRSEPPPDTTPGTDLSFRYETAVILVADIRNYTRMSEVLPGHEFSLLIADWFKESSDVIERHGGVIDKFIGDAVMSYWLARERGHPEREVDDALRAALELMRVAGAFAGRLSARFPEHTFRIGIGIHVGDAVAGNVGGGGHPSFTIVGDNVNIAFRLESLTKEKGCSVVVSRKVTEHASPDFAFSDLGLAEVKGRTEPISIWAMDVGAVDPPQNS